MCSVRIIPSEATQLKGIAYCNSHIDDFENYTQTKYCRFTEFNPLLHKLSKIVLELWKNDPEHQDFSLAKYRLQQLQVNLEVRSIEELKKSVYEYTDFVSQKTPMAISWEYETICQSINHFAGEVEAFQKQASPQSSEACDYLTMDLRQAKMSLDMVFVGGYGGIDFTPSFPPSNFGCLFWYASNKTLAMVTEYFCGQIEDFAAHLKNNEVCQYIKYKAPLHELRVNVEKLALYTNTHIASEIDHMQHQFAKIQSLLERRSVDSLQTRSADLCSTAFSLTQENFMENRGMLQRRFCQYRLEILQMKDFLSIDKKDAINRINQRLLRVKAAISPGTIDLRVRRDKATSAFFVFFLEYRSRSILRAAPLAPSTSSAFPKLKESDLILNEIKQLRNVLSLFDDRKIKQALLLLKNVQKKVHFGISAVKSSVAERVLFHVIRSNYLTEGLVRRAIVRTNVELTLAGFIERVKEEGRNEAETAFSMRFKTIGIWREYRDIIARIVNLKDADRALKTLEQIYATLKNEWQIA